MVGLPTWSVSAATVPSMAEALFKMCVGNSLGIRVEPAFTVESLFYPAYGSFVLEISDDAAIEEVPEDVTASILGTTTALYTLEACGEKVALSELQRAWENALEDVFPYQGKAESPEIHPISFYPDQSGVEVHHHTVAGRIAKPRVIIPVFPGTNCEYDAERAFRRAGAKPRSLVINNLTPQAVSESVTAMRGHPPSSPLRAGSHRAGSSKDLTSPYHDILCRLLVKVPGRFVCQQKLRTVNDRAGNGGPLLLPAGKLRRHGR